MKRLHEYIEQLGQGIAIMNEQGKETNSAQIHLDYLKARYPNRKTRIDLHSVYLEEAEKPIRHLYCSKFEIYCIQTQGFVPEDDTENYKSLKKSYYASIEE